jgi:hypothetical protein
MWTSARNKRPTKYNAESLTRHPPFFPGRSHVVMAQDAKPFVIAQSKIEAQTKVRVGGDGPFACHDDPVSWVSTLMSLPQRYLLKPSRNRS